MEFVIVRGFGNNNFYIEKVRFTIKLASANPTLKEMLDEVRKVYTDKEDIKEYGEFYVLQNFKTLKWMDSQKTAVDYDIKSGDKIILTFDYAKYKNLPPGVRGN